MTSARFAPHDEWLEADGLGGFASGTVSGVRTRRYHALLLVATTPPTGRFVLLNGFDAWLETPAGSFPITSQAYAPDILHPDGARRVRDFEPDPWPTWSFELEDGTRLQHELFVPRGGAAAFLSWRLARPREGVTLIVRPFLSGRDYHSLHHENPGFRFDAETNGERVSWRPYPGVPAIVACSNGRYVHAPDWYRSFRYAEERARGLDCDEDLASPGSFQFELSHGPAVLLCGAQGHDEGFLARGGSAEQTHESVRGAERKRRLRFPSRLARAGDAYLVKRGSGQTIVAGYPWFTDWGRDSFIALRGLCLAADRLDTAREILVEWSGSVSEGMLPNRFADHGEVPEYNSVDASLWYIVAVHDTLQAFDATKRRLPARVIERLQGAVVSILDGFLRGTRFGIRSDADGLLAAGTPGVQLTWMDAKVGDWVVTPRIGKPVDVQALWLNALRIASAFSAHFGEVLERGLKSFEARFWNEARGCLHDVVDVDHRAGALDASLRPNQILAVGGLPFPVLQGERARRLVDSVEAQLLTPVGLRSLAPGEPGYAPRYEGGVRERDGAYHQGTVWPWLLGPFAEAWVRVRGGTPEAKREARRRFLEPLLGELERAGLGHVSEIADAEAPYTPRGCPFQAWSVGEALRLANVVLGASPADSER